MTCKAATLKLMAGATVYVCTTLISTPFASSALAGGIPQFEVDTSHIDNFQAGERYGSSPAHNTYVHTGNDDFDNGANGAIGVRRSMEESKRTSDRIHEQLKQLDQDGGANRFTAFLLRRAIGGVKGLIDGGEPTHPVAEPQEATKAPDVAPPSSSFERFDQWQADHGKSSHTEPGQ